MGQLTVLELSPWLSYTRSQCGCGEKRDRRLEEEGMTPAVTSEAGKPKRKRYKIWIFVGVAAAAIVLLLVPLGKGGTVQFLTGMVLGLALAGILMEFSKGREK